MCHTLYQYNSHKIFILINELKFLINYLHMFLFKKLFYSIIYIYNIFSFANKYISCKMFLIPSLDNHYVINYSEFFIFKQIKILTKSLFKIVSRYVKFYQYTKG